MLGSTKIFFPSKSANDLDIEYKNGFVYSQDAKTKKIYYLDNIIEKIQKNVYYDGSDILKGLQNILNTVINEYPSEVFNTFPLQNFMFECKFNNYKEGESYEHLDLASEKIKSKCFTKI